MTSAERLAQYEDLFAKSQAFNPTQYKQDFEKAYGEATDYNKDLIAQQSGALGELQAVAPELRQRYSQTLIKDPTLQRSLIAQARQAPIADYSTAVNLLGQRGQRYADILGKSTEGYQTSAQQAQTAAENSWRMYQDQVAQEEAARARAAASSQTSLADILKEILGGGGEGLDEFEILEDDTKYGTASLGDSFQDRLTKQVLEQRKAQGFGDVLGSYFDTSLEPFRNLKTFGDFTSILPRSYAGATTIASDLFNRLFKR